MAQVTLPCMLADQAGGQRHWDVPASTLNEAIRALPVADLILTPVGRANPWLLIFINEDHFLQVGGLESPVTDDDVIQIASVLAGG